jgi:hypothetical protein
MKSAKSCPIGYVAFLALAVCLCLSGMLPCAVRAASPNAKPAPTPTPKIAARTTVYGYNAFGWQRVWSVPSSSRGPATTSGYNAFSWQRVWPVQPKAKGFPAR